MKCKYLFIVFVLSFNTISPIAERAVADYSSTTNAIVTLSTMIALSSQKDAFADKSVADKSVADTSVGKWSNYLIEGSIYLILSGLLGSISSHLVSTILKEFTPSGHLKSAQSLINAVDRDKYFSLASSSLEDFIDLMEAHYSDFYLVKGIEHLQDVQKRLVFSFNALRNASFDIDLNEKALPDLPVHIQFKTVSNKIKTYINKIKEMISTIQSMPRYEFQVSDYQKHKIIEIKLEEQSRNKQIQREFLDSIANIESLIIRQIKERERFNEFRTEIVQQVQDLNKKTQREKSFIEELEDLSSYIKTVGTSEELSVIQTQLEELRDKMNREKIKSSKLLNESFNMVLEKKRKI